MAWRFVAPSHYYLGPGNDALSGDEPFDDDDIIALVHDLEYQVAQSDHDIVRADLEAIQEFKDHFARTGHLGSLIGVAGLGLKYGVEQLFGVLYPIMNAEKFKKQYSNFGRYLYAAREKEYARLYKDAKQNGLWTGTYHGFRNSPFVAEAKKHYTKGSEHYDSLKYYYGQFAPRSVTDQYVGPSIPSKPYEEQIERTIEAGAVKFFRDYPVPTPGDDSGSDLSRNQVTRPPVNEGAGTSGSKRKDPPAPGGDPTNSAKAPRIADTAAGPSGNSDTIPDAATPQAPTAMDVDQSGSGRGPNTGARSGATASGGGGGGPAWISKSSSFGSASFSVSKDRIMFTYGLGPNNTTQDSEQKLSTSLGLIPVDFIPFYLTRSEFESLPEHSRVTRVSCQVIALGTRTAFETGTTTSGTATSEYIPIGVVGEGLNKKFYGENRSYDIDGKTNIVSSTKQIELLKMYERWYAEEESNVLGYPTPILEYWTHSVNGDGATVTGTGPNPGKLPRVDCAVESFLINQQVGNVVAEYEYTPHDGLITNGKEHYFPNSFDKKKLLATCGRQQAFNISKAEKGFISTDATQAVYSMKNRAENRRYFCSVDNYGIWNPRTGPVSFAIQPQLHVGILPTPQLQPFGSATSYLNATAYWQVKCSMEISTNFSSAFACGKPISWPEEVVFNIQSVRDYGTGQSMFGNITTGGRLTTEINDDEYRDDDEDRDSLDDFINLQIITQKK